MRIIFLDVDGVLNSNKTTRRIDNFLFVSVSKVKLLAEVVERTGARIVLSSSWRIQDSTVARELFLRLRKELLRYNIPIYSMTPIFEKKSREEEIKNWLLGKEVENFVILEDIEPMGSLVENCVFIDGKVGLSRVDAERAIKILGEKK